MFAAIYVPDFPVEAIVRLQPERREQAVVVIEGTPPLVRVIAVNVKAGEAGVEPGMTKLQAEESLAAFAAEGGRATSGVVATRSPACESAAAAALLDCACSFSPRVEATAADTVILDIAGLERIFGPPAKLAREVAVRCSQIGLEANVAIAVNPDAAMHAARGFAGVTVIPEGREAERLGSLPVQVLAGHAWRTTASQAIADCRLPIADCAGNLTSEIENHQCEEMLDILERWGVRTLRALAALPEVAVTERLGQAGLHWQRLARGTTARALHISQPPVTFEEAAELEYPIDLLEPLSFVLNRMLEQLCARLAARALATNELRLKLALDCGIAELPNCGIEHSSENNSAIRQFGNPAIFERQLRLPVPMLDVKVFLKLLQLDLASHPPRAPVLKVWLAAEPSEPRRTQNGLFLPSAPEAEKLEVTLARIQSSVVSRQSTAGELRAGSPELLDTHRPGAFRMRKFVPQQPPVASGQSSAGTEAMTALRVFRPPLRAEVSMRDGRPVRLEGEQVRGDIRWSAGPWRSSGDWWADQPWTREEWDVCIGDALYRIYRDTSGWFVEGSYD